MRWCVTVASLLLMPLVVLACGDDDDPTEKPAPTGTGTVAGTETAAEATATETATQTPHDGLRVMREIAPTPLDDLPLVIETGCWGCDAGPESLVRVSADGIVDLTGTLTSRGPITGYVISPHAAEIVVSICTAGNCSSLAGANPDGEVTFFRSQDGGAGWEEIGKATGAAFPLARTPLGVLIASFEDVQAHGTFRYLPSGEPVVAPEQARGFTAVRLAPHEDLLWVSEDLDALLRTDGSTYYRLPGDGVIQTVAAHPYADRLAIGWLRSTDRGGVFALSIVEGGVERAQFDVAESGIHAWTWLDDRFVLGNVGGGDATDLPVPVVFDIVDGTISRVDGPFATTFEEARDPNLIAERNFAVAAPAFHPETTRTSVPEVDRFLDAFFAEDAAALRDLVALTPTECNAEPGTGISGEPLCPEGVADRTEVPVFLFAGCEPNFLFDLGEAQDWLIGLAQQPLSLYLVHRGGFGLPTGQPAAFTIVLGSARTAVRVPMDEEGHVIGRIVCDPGVGPGIAGENELILEPLR